MSDHAPASTDAPDAALLAALARVLEPLARLAVARGLPHAVIDEMLRAAFVTSAHAAHPGLPPHRRVSRIAAATGINRREVSRLLHAEASRAAAPPTRTPAAMVFAHWRNDPAWRTKDGKPRVLPRTGAAPSFEALAHEVTRDVHPRALLEELLRLKLATLDEARDRVALVALDFIPRGDAVRMAQWMGANVGDHFGAAVANLVDGEPVHPEQAIAAEGLSEASVRSVRPLLNKHWQALTEDLVPLLERLIEQDRAGPAGSNTHRVRIGLYGFDDAPSPPATAATRPPRKHPWKAKP
ncbi:MAG TPA: DUF6502 family protein [Burkholderiaceae bacterium]|nr:DUF6502 family protein [Burkholderiaceae bacterium]